MVKTAKSIILCIAFLMLFASIGQATPVEDNSPSTEKQGWLGVSISDVSAAIAKKFDLKDRDGAYVSNVTKKSPAEAAGIKEGDIIIEIGSQKIFDADDLSKTIKRTNPQTKVTISVLRDGKRLSLEATLGTTPEPEKQMHRSFSFALPRMYSFIGTSAVGLKLLELNPQLAEFLGAPKDEGVLVEEVKKNSPAEKAGFKAGDVILRWGNRQVDEISDIRKSIARSDDGDKVDVEILRKGSRQKLTVQLEKVHKDFDFEIHEGAVPGIHIFRHRGEGDLHRWIELEELKPRIEELRFKIEDMTRELIQKERENRQDIRERIERIYRLKEI